jgi:cobyrinic acid a,c-diamide synthase
VRGFESFDPDVRIAGVIFNRVAGEGHFRYLREAVAAHCRAEVLGYLPPNPAVELPERHLGLHLACEVLTENRLTELCRWVEERLDLELLRRLGHGAAREAACSDGPLPGGRSSARIPRPRVGVARDRAFCFYYQDNLDLLTSLGAELAEFSPIADRHLPFRMDGLYLGGGYPELHAAALAANESMRAEVAAFVRLGGPVYAECGGFMYLSEAIVDPEEHAFPMVGVFPTRVRMQGRLAALGYVEVEGAEESGWLRPGEHARGHEFRYSTADEMPGHIARTYRSAATEGQRGAGYRVNAALASYAHLHFLSCPRFAERFVAACAAHKESSCSH